MNRGGRLSQTPHRTPKEELRRADKQPAHAETGEQEEEGVASHRRHREDEVLL